VKLPLPQRALKFPFFAFVFLLFCLPGFSLRAGENTSGLPENSEVFSFPLGEETLPRYEETCRVLAEHPVIKGNFIQRKTLSRLNRVLVSEGKFTIHTELGILWDTLSPFPSSIVAGRDFIIQSTPRGGRTKLDAQGNETFLRLSDTISAVFSGNSRRLLEGFDNYFTESKGAWVLGLVPSDKAVRSFAVKIIMTGDRIIKTITLYEQNGDIIRYELSNHTFPGVLSDSEKAFFFVP
jgi:outer membrane lipoprotein-sorting protein